MSSKQAGLPPIHINVSRAIKRDWLDKADPSTQVFVRAWCFGYFAETIPACVRLVLLLVSQSRSRNRRALLSSLPLRLKRIFVHGLSHRGLAFFFGVGLGGAKWLEKVLYKLLLRISLHTKAYQEHYLDALPDELIEIRSRKRRRLQILSTYISSFTASFIAFGLKKVSATNYQDSFGSNLPLVSFPKGSRANDYLTSRNPEEAMLQSKRYETPTLDLTLFLLVRAIDTAVRTMYIAFSGHQNRFVQLLAARGDNILFILSSWRIMWIWFYKPWLLPPSYDK